MPSRPLLFFGLIAAAIVVPYVATDKEFAKTAGDQWRKLTGTFQSKPKEPSLEELIDQLTSEHPPLQPWTPEPSDGQSVYASRRGIQARTVSSPSEGSSSGSDSSSGNSNSGSGNSYNSGSSNSYNSGSGSGSSSSNSYNSGSNSGGYNSGSSGSSYNSGTGSGSSGSSGSSGTNAGSSGSSGRSGNSAGGPYVDGLVEGPGIYDLWEIFRFDAPPSWVMARWQRVTTITSERELRGLRVPLMTGTHMDDLAGSLTYYFDRNQKVQRITFEGVTGDESRLVQLVSEQYGLRPVPSLQAGLYLGQTRSKITAAMRINNPPVINSKEPLKRMEVTLEINRPDGPAKLSDHMTELLKADRLQKKW